MEVDKKLQMEDAQRQSLMDTLLESSPQCSEDFLDAEPHPSNQTLVTFANLIYTPKTAKESDADYGKKILLLGKLDGWKILITANNTSWANGYFGAAFVNTASQQVVVAHRGTDPFCTGALYTDTVGIFGTQYTSCMNSATTFVEHIRQNIKSANDKNKHYTLAITGHSLGAWLSQITTFSVKYLAIPVNQERLVKNSDDGIHAKTVGFDSPGARDMLERVLDDYYDRYAMNVLLDELDITVYLSAPNHINTCGVHLGAIYHIFIDSSSFSWIKQNTVAYTLETHGMSNFVKAFKDEKWKISEVFDWPKSLEEYNKLFEKCDNKDENEYLIEKLYRLNVVELKSSENGEILKCSFRVFSKDELRMLYMLHELQEQKSEKAILNEFAQKNLKLLETNKFFPNFVIDHHNRMILGESLGVLCKRLKQLMRWMKPQFTQAVEDQIKVFPHAADFIYFAEGQSYLDSLPKCCLDFEDSIGFRSFLASCDERVLCIVSQIRDSAFQMSRLRNILHQIQRSVDSSDCSIKSYTNDRHYTFIDWTQLQKLNQIYKWPINKEYLIVVDSTSSSFINMNDCKTLIDHIFSKSMKLVIIASQPIGNASKFIKTIESDGIVQLKDLTIDSQKKLLAQNNVIITGDKAYGFREFLGEDISYDTVINQILSSEGLKNFATVENYTININDTRPTLVDLQMPFFKLHIKTSKAFILYCLESPNILVVMSRLSYEELETGGNWDQLNGNKIILVEGDAELAFKETCKENRNKTVYLIDVSGDEIYCKHIFDEDFYLPRKFFHRVCIDVQLLASKRTEDLFVISNEEEKTSLSGLLDNQMDREAFLKNVRIAATIIEEEEIIMQNSIDKDVHFVRLDQSMESHRVEWRYSHGSIEALRPCASTYSFESIDEKILSQTDRNLVILTDEPGMGKTTALAMLSRFVTAPFIIHIEIKQFKRHIARLSAVLNNQTIARFLLSECCSRASSSPVHKLLEHFLESKSKSKQIIVMIDGFDELDDYVDDKDRATEKIITLLIFLKNKPTVQIFLTVRKYLKESLEWKLSQFSTSFDEVRFDEQARFLVKFWQTCLPLELEGSGEEHKGQLTVNAKELLRRAKRVLRTDMSSFMGIPLQLRMLAEVFRPQRNLSTQSQDLLIFKQFDINSAPKLYKSFIKLKYDIYLHEKTLLGPKMGKSTAVEEILDYINETHSKLGFKSFFNSFFNNFFEDIPEKILDAMNRQGLLEFKRNNREFQFVHRTYAEYFCAQAVVYWLKEQGGHYKYPLFKAVLLPEILLLPNSKIIRLFMNDILQEIEMRELVQKENAEYISQLLLERSIVLVNSKQETTLHIAVQERNEYVIKFLLCRLNTVSADAQEAFASFILQSDSNHNTALNLVDGFLSNQYIEAHGKFQRQNYNYYITHIPMKRTRDTTEDTTVFNRIMEIIFRSVEACSEDLKKRLVFASLLNRDVFKSQISKFLRGSGDNARLLETVTRVLSEVSARLFTAVRKHDLVQIKALCNELNPVELQYLFLVKDIVPTTPDYPTVLHWAAHCSDLEIVKLLQKITVVPFAELMAEVDGQLRTPLHLAAGCGAFDVVRHLVDFGADVNVCDSGGKSALMYAAEKEHHSTVEYLLEHEADISMMDHFGDFVLLMAAKHGNLPLVKRLVEHEFNVNLVDNGGQSALQVAAMMGHLPVVEYLADHGAIIDHLSEIKLSALQMAVLMGHLPVVQYLVRRGAAVNYVSTVDPPAPSSISNPSLYTALQLAAAKGKLPVVEYLIRHGALLNSVDYIGRTALYRAVAEGHLQTVQYLVQSGVDVNIVDKNGISALHKAAEEGHVAIVEHLIQHEANVNVIDRDGLTALHKAANSGNLLIVQHLIEHNAIVNAIDKDGVSVLHKAAEEGYLETVQILIQNNASINALDNNGLSALHKAARGGHYRTVEYLVEKDADVKSIAKDGLSALYRAVIEGCTPTTEITFHTDTHTNDSVKNLTPYIHYRVVEYLINHGADLNSGNKNMDVLDLTDIKRRAKDEIVFPELHTAAWRGHLPTVDYLITQRHVDIEFKNETGQTALHKAAETGDESVIKFLVEKGADINCADDTGMTALQLAACEGNFSAVKYLIKQGANHNHTNNMGDTAISIASEFRTWPIVRMLADKGADVNAQGGIALSRAIEDEEWQMVEYLIGKGALVCEDQVKENLDKFKRLHPDYEFKKESAHSENASTALAI